MAMQQYSCMAPILLCGQRAVKGRESLTGNVSGWGNLKNALHCQLPAASRGIVTAAGLNQVTAVIGRSRQPCNA